MGLTIVAGGCRDTNEATGKIEEQHCNTCVAQEHCELHPQARQLAEVIANQWLRTDAKPPPADTAILLLQYSARNAASQARLGRYDSKRRLYIEAGSNNTLPERTVLAWMPIPPVPDAILKTAAAKKRRISDAATSDEFDALSVI